LSLRGLVRNEANVMQDLFRRLEHEDATESQLALPPSVSIKISKMPTVGPGVSRTPSTRPKTASISAKRSAAPAVPAAGPKTPSRKMEPPKDKSSVPETSLVVPGSKVVYRLVESGQQKTVVLIGPSVPRGISAVSLNAPIAQALMDAEVGERVFLELKNDDLEIEVVSITPPPAMTIE